MRHLKAGKKLNRSVSHRKALKKNLAIALLTHERIVTTLAKAKFIHKEVDAYITLGKRGDLHARRQAFAALRDKKVVTRLFTEYAERYETRSGGYSRVMKLSKPRHGDAASMAVVEMVDSDKFAQGKKPVKKKVSVKETSVTETKETTPAEESKEPAAESQVSDTEETNETEGAA